MVIGMFEQSVLNSDAFSDKSFAHYGVLGMKWGVRKNQNGSRTKKAKRKKSRKEKSKNNKNEKTISYGIFAASAILAKASSYIGSEAIRQTINAGEDSVKPEWFIFPLSALGVAGGVAGMGASIKKVLD